MGCTSESFQDNENFFDQRIKRNCCDTTGNSTDVHSQRILDGIPSESYALVASNFDKARQIRIFLNTGKGIEYVGDGFEGGKAL